jgi:hypothetical protein
MFLKTCRQVNGRNNMLIVLIEFRVFRRNLAAYAIEAIIIENAMAIIMAEENSFSYLNLFSVATISTNLVRLRRSNVT